MSTERMNRNAIKKCGIDPLLWLDYAEGELDPVLAKDLELHKETCPVCRRELHLLKLVKKGAGRSAPKMPDDLFFKRLEGKIMQAVEKTHIEPVERVTTRRLRFFGAATAAALVLVVGAPFMMSQWGFRGKSAVSPVSAVSSEDQMFAMNSGDDPRVLGEVLIGHQDSDDFVLEAAAEKLSRMSDQDARTALDKMK